jgi:hypothetical protein
MDMPRNERGKKKEDREERAREPRRSPSPASNSERRERGARKVYGNISVEV